MRCGRLLPLVVLTPSVALAQSTSPNININIAPLADVFAAPPETITFSEFPLNTSISDQYADRGIIFGGDSPFITTDGANPTSPVLSGTPRFQGAIEGVFVDPENPEVPVVVESFSLDAGFFDAIGSTRIEWFDQDGKKLGQRTNTGFGIENFFVTGGNPSSWKISVIANEPAGYAIDNVNITPTTTSVLFREMSEGGKDGSWLFGDDIIPGFDHVGFHFDNVVFESHPGYRPAGVYRNADGSETKFVNVVDGVQAEHTRGTFEHNSRFATTEKKDFEEIPIPRELAEDMKEAIEAELEGGAEFQADFSLSELDPASQKGGDNSFTCVGLVEFAAEQAGHNNGQGFVPNGNEAFTIAGFSIIPLLSPQLLNESMKNAALANAPQWFQGLFDPVDYMITDPFGRRLGFTQEDGKLEEIPFSFASDDGEAEQFLIANPVPGTYEIKLVGLNDDVFGGVASRNNTLGVDRFMNEGEVEILSFEVEPVPGGIGDVNGDGQINDDDLQLLIQRLNSFTNDPNDPADINQDGTINDQDVELHGQLVAENDQIMVEIDIQPRSLRNRINPRAIGRTVQVAILATPSLNPEDVDVETVRFEGALPVESGDDGDLGTFSDVDNDGDEDLVLRFRIGDFNLAEDAVEAMLTGNLLDGTSFTGTDKVEIVKK